MTYTDFTLILEYIALTFCAFLGLALTLFVLWFLIRLFKKDPSYDKWKKDKIR